MEDNSKTIHVEEDSVCYGSGSMPHYNLKYEEATQKQPERILVLGAGCPKCRALEQTVVQALDEMGKSQPVGHVTDYAEMAKYGVMSTPALVIDAKVVSAGRVLNKKDVLRLLEENL